MRHIPGHRSFFSNTPARQPEGLVVASRRGMLKASLAGIAGVSLPTLLQSRATAKQAGQPVSDKSIILLWMAGGPSHIDTWDPKPDRPWENRGPFGVIQTRVPGTLVCEHLPKQAAIMDKFTLFRSVDARQSNHEPDQIFQTGNLDAAPRVNPRGDLIPAIGSVIAKHHGAHHGGVPAYATFMKSRSHLAFGGYLGRQYDPFVADRACQLPIYTDVGVDTGRVTVPETFRLPAGMTHERLLDRVALRRQLDRLQAAWAGQGVSLPVHQQQALEMITGQRMQQALDLSREPTKTRDRYGDHLWCQQALLARRMVEAGVAFVTIDLSYHTASGTWDTHGDNIPPYGGISKGLAPLLPLFDHLLTTLVCDLEERGLLDQVLVMAMGEFGRTPQMGTQGSTDGRDHWPYVMSMCWAGGGLRHGQVIGSTEKDGGAIHDRPVTPGDIAATIYKLMGIPLDTTYDDFGGRPIRIVQQGEPIRELF